jgi:putative ABC transport system permease protein
MMLLSALARATLLLYPADFRVQFGEQILADLDDDPTHAAIKVLDLFKGAMTMCFDGFARDVVYALRRLRAAPLFLAIVVFTFALGIGANVVVFSVLNAVVLRPLPFTDPSSLAILSSQQADQPAISAVSVLDASDLESRSRLIAAIALTAPDHPTLLLHGRPSTLVGLDVTPNYLSILGIVPTLGRGLIATDGNPGVHNIIISNELWHKLFSADQNLVGRAIDLGGKPTRVVGILPPHQQAIADGLFTADFLEAMPANTIDPKERGNRVDRAIVRLASRASVAQTNAELVLISQHLQRLYPQDDAKLTFSLSSLTTSVLGAASAALLVIFAAVAGVLLIACANVGNLLAAQWASRDRELAIRRALGASLRNIAKQLLIETAVLATIGATLGVALAYAGLHLIEPLVDDALPRASSIGIDGMSLIYAVGVVVVATLVAGLLPLITLRTDDLQTVLKSAGRGGDSSRRNTLRSALVVTEVALALALVVLSGLMIRNFVTMIGTPLGIRPSGVVLSDPVVLSQGEEFRKTRELVEMLRALPGVDSAALAFTYPLSQTIASAPYPVVGRSYPRGEQPVAVVNTVTPDYFRTLGIPLIRGRDFADNDASNSELVAIVNEAYADRYLRGTNPIGVKVRMPFLDNNPATIVGVVGTERDSLTQPASPQVYQPEAQASPPFLSTVVYAPKIAPATIGHEIQDVFAKARPLAQPPDTAPMAELVAYAGRKARFATTLLGTLAFIALLLALAGIFGVVSYSVIQRSREFGVRMALGATAGGILGEVLRRSLLTAAVGMAIGLGIAAFAVRAITDQLTSISPFDPGTFAIVAILIFFCAALASLHPAIRAIRIQPAEALRHE